MDILTEFLRNFAEGINDYQGLFIVLFTFVLVVLNHSLARETKRLREKETEPDLEVYLVPAHAIPVINMVVRNTGGPARDVEWTIHADSADLEEHKIRILDMELFTTLRYFPSNERMEFFFGFARDLFKDPPLKDIAISVSYKNDYKKKKTSKTFEIDLRQFKGKLSAGGDPLREMAKHLDSMRKDVNHIATGFSKPHVLTQKKELYDKKLMEYIEQSEKANQEDTQPEGGQSSEAASRAPPDKPPT